MLQENHSAIELLKELFADENTFELYYLPVIEDTASHTYRFVLKNMKEDAFSYFLKLTTMMTELAKSVLIFMTILLAVKLILRLCSIHLPLLSQSSYMSTTLSMAKKSRAFH